MSQFFQTLHVIHNGGNNAAFIGVHVDASILRQRKRSQFMNNIKCCASVIVTKLIIANEDALTLRNKILIKYAKFDKIFTARTYMHTD